MIAWFTGRRHVLWLAVLLAILPPLTLHSSAYAQQRNTKAFVYQPASSTLNDLELSRFTGQLTLAARNAIAPALDPAEVRIKDALLIVGCDAPSPACMERIAESTNVGRIFFLDIERDEGLYHVRFNSYDQPSKKLITHDTYFKNTDSSGQAFYDIAHSFLSGEQRKTSLNINGPSEMSVSIQGKPLGNLPLSIDSLNPDDYDLEIKKGGKLLWTGRLLLEAKRPKTVQISEGTDGLTIVANDGVRKETLSAPATASRPATPSVVQVIEQPPSSPTFHWGGWTLLGIGAAAMITGGVFAALVTKKEKEADVIYNAYLQNGRREYYIGLQRPILEAGRRYEALEFTFFGVGAALIVAGAAWLTYDLVTYEPPNPSPKTLTPAALMPASTTTASVTETLPSSVQETSRMQLRFSVSPTSVHTRLVW